MPKSVSNIYRLLTIDLELNDICENYGERICDRILLPGWLVGHIIMVPLTESYTSIHKGGEHRISIIRN